MSTTKTAITVICDWCHSADQTRFTVVQGEGWRVNHQCSPCAHPSHAAAIAYADAQARREVQP